MIKKIFEKIIKPKHNLSNIELYLDDKLKTVTPRMEFVTQLRQQLIGKQKNKAFSMQKIKKEDVLLVFGALASVVLVLIAGIRAVTAILGALGLLQASKQTRQKGIRPASPIY